MLVQPHLAEHQPEEHARVGGADWCAVSVAAMCCGLCTASCETDSLAPLAARQYERSQSLSHGQVRSTRHRLRATERERAAIATAGGAARL